MLAGKIFTSLTRWCIVVMTAFLLAKIQGKAMAIFANVGGDSRSVVMQCVAMDARNEQTYTYMNPCDYTVSVADSIIECVCE